MKSHSLGFRKPFAARAVLVAAASVAAVASMATQAAVIDSGTVSIPITDSIDGVYVNVVTGATGASGAGVVGWDINPYNNSTGLTFFFPAAPAGTSGAVIPAAATPPQPLPLGTVIGPASTFSASGQIAGTNFRSGGPLTVGFRFQNEATAAINYGYMTINTTAGTGFPATVVRYVYENAGTPITIAGAQPPLTSTPATGSTVTFPPRTVGGPASTGSVTFNNPGTAAAAVTCAISGAGAAAFSSTGLTPSVPAAGSASVPLSYTSATPSTSTATLTCTSGAQTFTFTLSGTTGAAAPAAVSVPVFHGKGLLVMLTLVFGFGLATLLVRRN
jgi:hypothetical protein